jgi:hypothetical protein
VAFSPSFRFLSYTIILLPTVKYLASRFYQPHPLFPPLLGKERGRNIKEEGKALLLELLPPFPSGEGHKANSQENRRFFWVLRGG